MTMTNEEKAQELEAEAKIREDRSRESFERVDTDGFLSQWASDITARKLRVQADIERAGGVQEFPALFDLEGNRAPAKLIRGRYGMTWLVKTGPAYEDVKFISAFPKREATMERKGYREGHEVAPARAILTGDDGPCSVAVTVIRLDGGHPEADRIFSKKED